MAELLVFLVGAILILVIGALVFLILQLQKKLDEIQFSKSSQSVKFGQMSEQWLPFSKNFPYSSKTFKFLGQPIDGIAFEDGKIVFCEFKTGSSQLSDRQKQIKKLVEGKKIEWFEMRMN